MCGRGKRLKHLSEYRPKWAINLLGHSILELALSSTRNLAFDTICVVGLKNEFESFSPCSIIENILKYNEIIYYLCDTNTNSQVETALLGGRCISRNVPFSIQNIDTCIDIGFSYNASMLKQCDVFLTTFESNQPQYSYLNTDPVPRISDGFEGSFKAITGLYGFKSLCVFERSANSILKSQTTGEREATISDIINDIILQGGSLAYKDVFDCVPLGTEDELQSYLNMNE